MKKTPSVQLYILSCDRVSLCRRAIKSALLQSYENLEVILSDNSINDDVMMMVYENYPNLKMIRRKPQLAAVDHFNTILNESISDLLVMFHDDDELHDDYVASMVEVSKRYPNAVAFACNAYRIDKFKLTSNKLMGKFNGVRYLNTAGDLLRSYLSFECEEPAPFPGYMYRINNLSGLEMNFSRGGKHCDVSFLCEVIKRGPILWTSECYFNYRIHGSNDSSIENVSARLSLLRYIHSALKYNHRDLILMDYRFVYWRNWILQTSSLTGINNNRRNVVSKFLFFWTVRMALTRLCFWERSFQKIIKQVSKIYKI